MFLLKSHKLSKTEMIMSDIEKEPLSSKNIPGQREKSLLINRGKVLGATDDPKTASRKDLTLREAAVIARYIEKCRIEFRRQLALARLENGSKEK